jgi:hypothetical protein
LESEAVTLSKGVLVEVEGRERERERVLHLHAAGHQPSLVVAWRRAVVWVLMANLKSKLREKRRMIAR